MKTVIAAIALALPLAAAATTPAPREERGFHDALYQRYCDKLRESPEAYVQFVRRLQPVYGYTFNDFAPEKAGDAVRADCRVDAQRVAAVHRALAKR